MLFELTLTLTLGSNWILFHIIDVSIIVVRKKCVCARSHWQQFISSEIRSKFTQVSLLSLCTVSTLFPPYLSLHLRLILFLSLSLFVWKYKITAHELDQYEEVKTSGVHWVLSDLNWHKLGGFLLADLMGTGSDWLTRRASERSERVKESRR